MEFESVTCLIYVVEDVGSCFWCSCLAQDVRMGPVLCCCAAESGVG